MKKITAKYLLISILYSFGVCVLRATPPPQLQTIRDTFVPVCTAPNATKYIRINIHFILKNNDTGNFTEIDDGNGNTAINGYRRAEMIIDTANKELALNNRMWLPGGNKTAVLPTRLQYVLTGVYFHRDETVYGQDFAYNPDHCVNQGKAYNYFFNNVPGKKLNGWGHLGGDIACSYDYGSYLDFPLWITGSASLFNHEIGHCLGLSHTWNTDDGCDDTPMSNVLDANGNRTQCWNQNPDAAHPCHRWENISNNVMDYNQWYPHAYTPCQIDKIHTHLNRDANNYIISCNGCAPPNAFFQLRGDSTANAQAPLFLVGSASVNENRYMVDICEVIREGSPVCLNNTYNSRWFGGQVGEVDLKSFYTFESGKSYYVKLTVTHVNCPYPSVATRYLTIR